MANKLPDKFLDYLKTFNKQPGEYTEEEQINIGIYHQGLQRAEKNWNDVTSLLGITDKTGEQFRKWILWKRYQANQVEKNPKILDDKTVEEVTEDDVSNSLIEQKQALVKEKMKLRDERTSLNRTLRNEARFDELKCLVEQTIKHLTPLPVFNINSNTGASLDSSAEGILMLSDWHIGQDCNNFYNQFNLEIAEKRLANIINDAIEYCRKFNVTTLHVLNLGDLIEGTINNRGRIESNEVTTEQLFVATEYLANALNKLQAYIPVVTYRSVTDNHSNISQNYKDRLSSENLNLVVTWYLKARLSNSKIIFKDDNLDIGLGRFKLQNGMCVAFFHGHEDPKDKTLQNIVGATHEWTDIVCAGHLHNPAEHVYQNMRLFVNGSLCGTGPYALSHRLFTKPSQKLIIVDNYNFLNIDISAE